MITAILMDYGYGLLSGSALLEALVAGPVAGLLVGGGLDRAYDVLGGPTPWKAIFVAGAALAICGCLGGFMAWQPLGPNPDKLANTAKVLILDKWRQDPTLRDATIETITISRIAGKHYAGFFDANVNGWQQRFSLTVTADDKSIAASWEPVAR